jgi:hypothetical protein
MPSQDEYVVAKPPALFTPDGKPRPQCRVRGCKRIAGRLGLCRHHHGDRDGRRLRAEVRQKGIDMLRKSR